jgi:hypothetical protein
MYQPVIHKNQHTEGIWKYVNNKKQIIQQLHEGSDSGTLGANACS